MKKMKRISRFLLLVGMFTFKAHAADKKPWVYLDLGDTIVNTKDMTKIRYMKGAREYIEQLKREGMSVGIISNIPEEWGLDYEEKLQKLKDHIEKGWVDEVPFDWTVFDEIILPLKNTEMKPAPTLFLKAIQKANSCPSLFIGESPREVVAARSHGMASKQYDNLNEEGFVPPEEVRDFLKENHSGVYDETCL